MPCACFRIAPEKPFAPRNRSWAAAVVAVVALVSWGCSTEKSREISWQEFVSAAGRYRVTMPPVKDHLEEKAPMPGGETTVVTDFAQAPDGRTFAAVYADYPPGPDTTEEAFAHRVLDSVVSGVHKATKGTIRQKSKIKLAKHHGQECTFDLPQGRTRLYRAYLVDNRLYQLFAEWPPAGGAGSADAEKFVNSFQLNP
jgi:hypothetical protein